MGKDFNNWWQHCSSNSSSNPNKTNIATPSNNQISTKKCLLATKRSKNRFNQIFPLQNFKWKVLKLNLLMAQCFNQIICKTRWWTQICASNISLNQSFTSATNPCAKSAFHNIWRKTRKKEKRKRKMKKKRKGIITNPKKKKTRPTNSPNSLANLK